MTDPTYPAQFLPAEEMMILQTSSAEHLRFYPDGRIYVRGRLAETDKDVVDGLRAMLVSGGIAHLRTERDAAIARAEKAERERDDAVNTLNRTRVTSDEMNSLICSWHTIYETINCLRDVATSRADRAEANARAFLDALEANKAAIRRMQAELVKLRAVAEAARKLTDMYEFHADGRVVEPADAVPHVRALYIALSALSREGSGE